MATFSGMVHDFLAPTPISSAEVDNERLSIRQGSWIFEARSCDGFYYEGNYGHRKTDPKRHIRCWLYPGPDGTKIVYSCWHNSEEPSAQGESVYRLVPTPDCPEANVELPAEWDRARQVLKASAHVAAGALLELLLVHDRWTGVRKNQEALDQAGLYVLFYGNGTIARVGQARVYWSAPAGLRAASGGLVLFPLGRRHTGNA
jgi:hypothetical protein